MTIEGLKKRRETKEARACVVKAGNLGETISRMSEQTARSALFHYQNFSNQFR